jgi:hypothetical protein
MRIFTFWQDSPLSYIERMCLASMLAAGHSVDLYSYDELEDVPAGVSVKDARLIMTEDRIIRHKSTGSIALFANLFRYEGLRRGAGMWLDTDVLLLRSLDGMGDYIFGWEDHKSINNAILLLPPESDCLKLLLEFTAAPILVPPYWSYRRQLLQLARSFVGMQKPVEELGWGAIGPKALTHFVKSTRQIHLTQPFDVFYPIHWRDVAAFWSADYQPESHFTSSTRAVHLWNKGLKRTRVHPPPADCFIARMCKRFGIEPTAPPGETVRTATDLTWSGAA